MRPSDIEKVITLSKCPDGIGKPLQFRQTDQKQTRGGCFDWFWDLANISYIY